MTSQKFTKLQTTDVIVFVGSIDGQAAAAALMRHIGDPSLHLVATQAFEVDRIDPRSWPALSRVGFVDLAVNNQDPGMTKSFVQRVRAAGHQILFVADEHGREAWLEAMGGTFAGLLIEPQDRSEERYSASAILMEALADQLDEHGLALLKAGDEGDQFRFDNPLGMVFNRAVKSNMGDAKRRPHLVRTLAFSAQPDQQIESWMAEYDEIEANHPRIVAAGKDLGNGIILLDGGQLRHDATTLMSSQYRTYKVVVLRTSGFVKGSGVIPLVSIGVNNKSWDLIQHLRTEGIEPLGGFAQKANIRPEDEQTAIAAVRKLIK